MIPASSTARLGNKPATAIMPVKASGLMPVRKLASGVRPIFSSGIVAHAAADAALPPPPPITGTVLMPPAAYQAMVNVGATKALLPSMRTFVMGIQAGFYIGFGGFMALSVGGSLAGALPPGIVKLIVGLVFPVGLMLTTLCGAELYTGNTAALTAARVEGKASMGDLMKNWMMSYLGNFVGSVLMAAAVFATGMMVGNPMPVAMTTAKCSLTFGQALVRGILANWLVCTAVWMSTSASSLPGKVMGIWPPIFTFVTIGLEHSVANMFFLTLGIWCGAPVSLGDFLFKNLLPVTIGNTIAGVVFMAVAYGYVFGALGKPKAA